MTLLIIFDTFEGTSYFIDELLEHGASCLLVEYEPSADYHHLCSHSENPVKVEVIEKGEFIYLVPLEVVDTPLS